MDKINQTKLLDVFGLNIKYEREKRKIKQEELAEKLHCSSVYISNVENGKHNISLINAVKFSKFFGLPIEELLKEK